MSDADHDDGFEKAFEGFGDEPKTPVDPPKDDPKPEEDPKKDEQPPAEPPKEEEATTPTGDAPKKEEDSPPPKDPAAPPETPPAAEEPKPLTADDFRKIINEVRTEERFSGQALEAQTKDVLDAYYPDGLSNVLVDQNTKKELRTPQDVVDATNGEMSTEQAAQWLMNEQYKLDQEVASIKKNATEIAETTINFKRGAEAALQKYEPLFKAYPHLQKKAYDRLMQQTKADPEKGVILSAPDVMDHYDFYLEPYQLAFEHATGQSATNATPPPSNNPAPPPPPAPSAEDRLDEGGDGGSTPPDDPNDFGQQLKKELAKGP